MIGDAHLRLRSFAPGRMARISENDVFKIKGLAIRQLLIQIAHMCELLRFADLVVMAGRLHPFPFRTRP
jgi:hypothetical protein